MQIRTIGQFWDAESGATAIEYGLLVLLIAMAIIGTFTVLGNNVEALFNNGATQVLADRGAGSP